MKRKYCPDCLADIEVSGDTEIICYCGSRMIDLNFDVRMVRKQRKVQQRALKLKNKASGSGTQ